MARRIAVAATAPLGADVLERLAAAHDVVQLLTRPDRPRGRGRKVGAPPAKEAAERLGIPVVQPARLDESVELAADTVVVCAYGALIPAALLERALWLNVHPSLLPRWRGAAPVERALLAGDAETGVTIHRTIEALDAGPVAAQRAFPLAPDDDAGTVYARAGELAAELLGELLARPGIEFVAAGRRGRHLRGEDRTGRPRARSHGARGRGREPRAGALAAHRRARGRGRAAAPRLEGAGRRGRVARARRGTAGRRTPDGLGRVPARPPMSVSPARRVAYEVLLRVFEQDATPIASSGRPPRGSTSASGRSRSGSPTVPSSASARSTTRSRRSGSGPSPSSTRRCGPRSGSAPTSSATRRPPRTRPSTSRSSSCAGRVSSGRSRSRTRSCAASPRGCGRCSTRSRTAR